MLAVIKNPALAENGVQADLLPWLNNNEIC